MIVKKSLFCLLRDNYALINYCILVPNRVNTKNQTCQFLHNENKTNTCIFICFEDDKILLEVIYFKIGDSFSHVLQYLYKQRKCPLGETMKGGGKQLCFEIFVLFDTIDNKHQHLGFEVF